MNNIDFYLHHSMEMSEIKEYLRDYRGVLPENVEGLAEEIYNQFYEVKFDIEYEDNKSDETKIRKIRLISFSDPSHEVLK